MSLGRKVTGIGLVAAIVLLFPIPANAYVGPGAGFAVLSSFLAMFLGFVYSVIAVVTWPFRQLRRLVRNRKALRKAQVKRIVILGLDGLDPILANRYMSEGKLPNFAKLRDSGMFSPLKTTTPPISPVAWSSFQTGVNPGKHNIFDFLARDPATYLPYLSSAQIAPPRHILKVGRYEIPIGRPPVKMLRKARPFWHYVSDAGIFSSIIRVPITFPPEKFSGVLLSGMCVPDLAGTQGTFASYTSQAVENESGYGGTRLRLEPKDGWHCSHVLGPQHPLHGSTARELRVPFRLRANSDGHADLNIQHQRFRLVKGEYSPWIELKFRAAPGFTVQGICRFYLKESSPEIQLYVTPVNIHPGKPVLPVSHPFTYSIYLSKRIRPFATLGLAEDTWALNEGVLDDQGFLKQCYLNHEERERMFFDAIDKTRQGLCACVFDTPDRIQHMFWGRLNQKGGASEELYIRMDALVARTLNKMDSDSLLIVLSDHGFKSFQRGFNANSWLYANGYLALQTGRTGSGSWFADVDWTRTRAYAMGLNGLYINRAGRERFGIVAAGAEATALKQELREKLCAVMDPRTGSRAILDAFDSSQTYTGPYRDDGPDIVIGYQEGYRAGWDSVTGKVAGEIFLDNDKAWCGDHCIHPDLVPGVLFSNRRLLGDQPAIIDIAPTVLDLFGLALPKHFDGKPLRLST